MKKKEKPKKNQSFQKKMAEFPAAVKNKLITLFLLFIGGGAALILALLAAGMSDMWYFPLIIMGYGIYLIFQLYYMASSGNLKETEGVVIDKERSGYRKQNSYLIVQTSRGVVYRVIATDRSSQYKEGDIVRFYSTKEALNHLKDGVFEVRVVYAIERVSAKVTTDEEDEKIRLQEEAEKELQQNT